MESKLPKRSAQDELVKPEPGSAYWMENSAQDYQMQLMLLEQQRNKKRMIEELRPKPPTSPVTANDERKANEGDEMKEPVKRPQYETRALNDYHMQLYGLQRLKQIAELGAKYRPEADTPRGSAFRPKPPGPIPADEEGMPKKVVKVKDETKDEIKDAKPKERLLEPLPPRIPEPEYLKDGAVAYSFDNESQAFYRACAEGQLRGVREFLEDSKRPCGDLQFGLEEAAHAFQLDVVRYLMEEHDVGLHTGVFEHLEGRASSQTNNIFLRNDPRMLDLLRIFLDNGWSPNQTWTSPQYLSLGWVHDHRLSSYRKGRQNVALHFPQCVRDTRILGLLLEHGADPNICPKTSPLFALLPSDHEYASEGRKSGHTLNLAVRVGTPETVDLLLAHGASVEYGRPLHCLIQRPPAPARGRRRLRARQGHSPPPPAAAPAPDLARLQTARFQMADHLVRRGVDLNAVRSVHGFVTSTRSGEVVMATALSHAVGFRDWDFVEWLLEKGADPEAHNRRAFDDSGDDDLYAYGNQSHVSRETRNRFPELIEKVKSRRRLENAL